MTRRNGRYWFNPDRPKLYALQVLSVFYLAFAIAFAAMCVLFRGAQ